MHSFSEGDRGASHFHNLFFEKYFVHKGEIRFKCFKPLLTHIYTDIISQSQTITVSDSLHLFITFRDRLMEYII